MAGAGGSGEEIPGEQVREMEKRREEGEKENKGPRSGQGKQSFRILSRGGKNEKALDTFIKH